MTSAVHDRLSSLIQTATTCGSYPGMTNLVAANELLKPYDARLMRCHPVSTRVNSATNDDEECSAPVEIAEVQNRLFS